MLDALTFEPTSERVMSLRAAMESRADLPPYSISFESPEDAEDARSILYGLDVDSKLFKHYPSFDTWRINPLHGIEKRHIAYLQTHARSLAPWFRSPRDVLMRLSLIVSRPSGEILMPIIWLGLANLAEHVALLGSMSKEKRCRFVAYLDQKDRSVQIGFADLRGRLIFSGRVAHSDCGSDRSFATLLSVERNGGKALLVLPASAEGHQREMVSALPSIGSVQDICNTPMLLFQLDFASSTATRIDELPRQTRHADIQSTEAA